jgi:hypothetical protein
VSKGKKRVESEEQKQKRLKQELDKNNGMSKFQRKEMARRQAEFPRNQVVA